MKRACLLAFAFACGTREERQEPRPPSGEVWLTRQQIESQQLRIEIAAEHPVASRVDAPGRISFDDLHVAHIFSPASGRVAEIYARPGQLVRKGAPLLALEAPDVGSALSDVGKAEADLSAAARELKRQRELVAAHAGAQRDLDQAESAWERAKAEVARARERARLFRDRGLDRVRQQLVLRAPIDGEIIARNANPGAEVPGQYAGGSSPELFTVGSIDTVWAVADVFEMDLPRIQAGAEVDVKVVAFPDRSFPSRVDWISTALDPTTRTARVRATLRNPGHELLPEMYATISIGTAARRTLAVPRSAIVHAGSERLVFVQAGVREDGSLRFQRRRIVAEDAEGDLVPIKSGLQAGEAVVVEGALLLSGML